MSVSEHPAATAVDGAGALVAALEQGGVEVVFGLPGVHALPIWDALARSPIRTVLVRHEQAASFAAVGYARSSGRPGVLLTSTGPGAMNAMAGLGEADAASAPVLHLTTQIPTPLAGGGRGHLHETSGQSAAFAAVSRYHACPATPEALAASVGRALRELELRPGPAVIEAAMDVLAAACDGALRPPGPISPPAPDAGAVERVLALLADARAPLIWAGGGCAGSAEAVRALAEELDAPVLTTFNGKGVLRSDHPLHLGSSVEEAAVRKLVEASDVCLALGTRFSQETTADWRLPLPEALVQVDIDGGRIGRSFPVREGIVSDAGRFCRALLAAGPSAGGRDGAAAVRAARAARGVEIAAQGAGAELELLAALAAALPEDAIVVSDMTVLGYWATLYLDVERPSSFLYPASGALGAGVPLALGTAAAHPGRRTVVLVGDGGFLLGGHELLSARAEGLAMTVLLVNDSAYGILRHYQERMFGRTTAVELNAPDFELLARAYDIPYLRATGASDLGRCLADAAEHRDGPVLVELQAALRPPGQSV